MEPRGGRVREAHGVRAAVEPGVHDKRAGDEPFLDGLALIEQAAGDERNFVKKAVNMALRGRRQADPALQAAALALAERLAASPSPPERWVGKDVLKDLRKGS